MYMYMYMYMNTWVAGHAAGMGGVPNVHCTLSKRAAPPKRGVIYMSPVYGRILDSYAAHLVLKHGGG